MARVGDPYYTGTCDLEDCPANTDGAGVGPDGCVCADGYTPSTAAIVPTTEDPYYEGVCMQSCSVG
eukprot:SAG11_NODE_25871_length_352_cov_0.448819_1_plen_65_part_10